MNTAAVVTIAAAIMYHGSRPSAGGGLSTVMRGIASSDSLPSACPCGSEPVVHAAESSPRASASCTLRPTGFGPPASEWAKWAWRHFTWLGFFWPPTPASPERDWRAEVAEVTCTVLCTSSDKERAWALDHSCSGHVAHSEASSSRTTTGNPHELVHARRAATKPAC